MSAFAQLLLRSRVRIAVGSVYARAELFAGVLPSPAHGEQGAGEYLSAVLSPSTRGRRGCSTETRNLSYAFLH